VSKRGLIVFDMDGVLVDVSESYRETIRRTVHHFSGQEITKELIQDYKNAGGWNNDWALSQKILSDLGTAIDYQIVVDEFQKVFFGIDGEPGLIQRERWIPRDGLLERLQQRYDFAIFTGRLRDEASISLDRFVPELQWARLVGDDDVKNGKPHPEGLLLLAGENPGTSLWYIGDTVDDARSAKAAGVPFIGIADKNNPRYSDLCSLLNAEGAIAVLENINELETVL